MSCCCLRCGPSGAIIDTKEELRNRKAVLQARNHEWEKLGTILDNEEPKLNINKLSNLVIELREINERLQSRKDLVGKNFKCSRILSNSSWVGIIATTALTSGLLASSSLTSCGEGGWAIFCVVAASVSFLTPLTTMGFQSCHDRLKEEKIRLESFIRKETHDDRLIERVVLVLNDYQNIHLSGMEKGIEEIKKMMSVHSLGILDGCENAQEARVRVQTKYHECLGALPQKYFPGRWQRALNAITEANRITKTRERQRVFDSNEMLNEQKEINEFRANHNMDELRDTLLTDDGNDPVIIQTTFDDLLHLV